jgi:hypothetical protein
VGEEGLLALRSGRCLAALGPIAFAVLGGGGCASSPHPSRPVSLAAPQPAVRPNVGIALDSPNLMLASGGWVEPGAEFARNDASLGQPAPGQIVANQVDRWVWDRTASFNGRPNNSYNSWTFSRQSY